MPLYFIDRRGNEGTIEDDLDVSYAGPAEIAESVESCIDEVEDDAEASEEVFRSLFVELPERCAVREIGRIDGESVGD